MAVRTGRRGFRSATSYAPGHVTGLFAPEEGGDDPRAHGSVGAGIVLDLGVESTVRWWPAGRDGLVMRGNGGSRLPITRDVHRRLVGKPAGRFEIRLHHQLPIGQGFGMSAAGALATALATARVAGVARRHAIDAAHLSDLAGGGGLGGVAAILGGGWELRERPGVPPFGRIVHRPFRYPVFLGVVDRPLPSPRVLGDPEFHHRVSVAAGEGFEQVRRSPTPRTFLEESERFTDTLALGSQRLSRTIRALRSEGVRVGQAMFGGSFFAVPTSPASRRRLVRTLASKRLGAIELRASDLGARLVTGSGRSLTKIAL